MSMLLPRPTPRTLLTSLLYLRPTTTTTTAANRLPFSSHTSYPLYYELISHSPAPRPRLKPPPRSSSSSFSSPDQPTGDTPTPPKGPDRAKRKYYRKMEKRMYGGSDSDDPAAKEGDPTIELRPQVVDFPTLHRREEELYFYDTFAMPWEKDKHYKMVYQLEKKYFPEQCLDKAFVDVEATEGVGESERGMVFFDEKEEHEEKERKEKGRGKGVEERKVEEFFKDLKKRPSEDGVDARASAGPGDPFLSSRKAGLPPRWDRPAGTVVLVDKPKGWTSFTVCGKLRRLVKVQKVGHAGTLDPMATGLLIVCVGKATKLMERYQGMIKGYSGIFRLGEATSTWDADSPVLQREPWEHIKDEDIRKAAASFRGEIWQVPPMFSAIKVGGERMYDKARRGESVELSPRRISIFQFDVERSLDDRFLKLV